MFEMGQCFLCHSAWVSAPSAAAPSGVVTFLFTDVEGSTRRWESDAQAMRAALVVHDKVLRTAIEAYDGFLFSHTGDGFVAAFASPMSAVNAAIDAQRELQLPVRMGLATGEAELRDGDYFGTVPTHRVRRGPRAPPTPESRQIISRARRRSPYKAAESNSDRGTARSADTPAECHTQPPPSSHIASMPPQITSAPACRRVMTQAGYGYRPVYELISFERPPALLTSNCCR